MHLQQKKSLYHFSMQSKIFMDFFVVNTCIKFNLHEKSLSYHRVKHSRNNCSYETKFWNMIINF